MIIGSKKVKRSTLILFILMMIFFIKGIFYAAYVTPLTLGTAPDDVGHFSYIQYISSEKKLPILYETKLENTSEEAYKAYYQQGDVITRNILVGQEKFDKNNQENWIVQHPPLYYLLMTPVYMICKLFTRNLVILLLSLRLATLFFGVATLFVMSKILDILKVTNVVRFCIYITFVFSVPIQFYFTNITNDSLLILLCTLSLYFLLKYTMKKLLKNYYLFIVCCALVVITKYTGGLVLIGYVTFFLYKSIREDGIKKTLKLCVLGGILGSVIISPVLIRNLLLYGKLFITFGVDTSHYHFTLYQFVVEKGYLNGLFLHLIMLIGWAKLISASELTSQIMALILAFSACLYCCNRSKKQDQYVILCFGIVMAFVANYLLKSEFSIGIIISASLVIVVSTLKSEDLSLHKREISIFFAITLIIVFAIFALKHYEILCIRGELGAMHGRYYYIGLFPILYLLFHCLENIKYTKYVPIVLMTALILCETQTVMQCILTW